MAAMTELFSTEFMTRGQCGNWSDGWERAYVIANLFIFFAYCGIVDLLLRGIIRSKDKGHYFLKASLVAVFLTCGIGHLEQVVVFFWPAYHLFALWHIVTAAMSWWGVLMVWRHRSYLIQRLFDE